MQTHDAAIAVAALSQTVSLCHGRRGVHLAVGEIEQVATAVRADTHVLGRDIPLSHTTGSSSLNARGNIVDDL